ncbi:unnamed protein product, partial [Rotaria magnacalcarata]
MILKSTLGTDTNYETSSASRVEPDDDEDISKK